MIRLTEDGLEALLDKTKTSGPGKKHRWLPIFVDVHCSVTGKQWLRTGYNLWQQDGMMFNRDYFLPLPSEDYQGCLRRMARYSDASAMGKALLMELRVPGTQELLIVCKELLLLYTEHSERNWATSLAALLKVPKERRDYLGRWHITSTVDEYVRTAPLVVREVQSVVALAARSNHEEALHRTGLAEAESFLQARQVPPEAISEQLKRLTFKHSWVSFNRAIVDKDIANPGDSIPLPDEKVDSEFFISISKKNKFRRLHKMNSSCGVIPGVTVLEFESYVDIKGVQYDDYCHKCWKEKPSFDDETSSGSSSSEDN
jgi:hypothetical protein